MIAKHNGYCPKCGKYIAKGRSKIVALANPLQPITSWSVDGDRPHHTNYVQGVDSNFDWRKVKTHARTWVHERCADR